MDKVIIRQLFISFFVQCSAIVITHVFKNQEDEA